MMIDYEIHREWRKSLSISVGDNGIIVVKAPVGLSAKEIENFVSAKKRWICKRLDDLKYNMMAAEKMGKISKKEKNRLRKEARRLIGQRVEYFAKLMGVSYESIRFGFQKSRWGSCSSKRNLNFNCLLALMPPMAMDSVVVHELCHLRYMNHSSEFYEEVLKYFPDYYEWNNWLKKNGQSYFLRIEDDKN